MSEAVRTMLAQRAKERRRELHLSRPEIARRIGISAATLICWERILPIKPKSIPEHKWEEALAVPAGWIRTQQMEAPDTLVSSEVEPVCPSEDDTVASEIRAVGYWLCRASPTRRTTDGSKLSTAERRWAGIFALRYGIDGEDNTTLQSIGNRHGLTRERIRQITEKMIGRASRLSMNTPCIDRLAAEMLPHLPASADAIDERFRSLLGERLSIVSAGRFCREILGRNCIVLTDRPAEMTITWAPTVIDPRTHDAERLRVVREISHRMIRSCGAAHVMFVAGAVSEQLARGVLPADVVHDCRMVPGFEWLLEKDEWFWFGHQPENRLLSVATKILVVAGQRVDAEEVLAGLVRSRRHYYPPKGQRPFLIEPPLQAVIEVLKRVEGISVIQSDDFLLDRPLPVEDVLSDTEHAIYVVMRNNGNIASRYMLNNQLVKAGNTGFMALQVCLDTSPIFRHLDRGIFALRGVSLDSAALEAAKNMVGGDAQRKVPVQPMDEAGGLRYRTTFEFSAYAARVRFWGVPSALAKVMEEGEYRLNDLAEPVEFVRLPNGNNRLRKFVSKLIQLGCAPGDQVALTVNVAERSITAEKLPA